MTTDFEMLLRAAAPEVPDTGDVRRLNRRELRKVMKTRGRRRRLEWSAATACVALLLVSMTFVGDLGSDNFDVTGEEAAIRAGGQMGVQKILRLGQRGQAVPLLDGWTQADARELANQAYNDEGQLLNVVGWRTPEADYWVMGYSSQVGGETRIRTREPRGMPARVDREFVDFMASRGAVIGRNPEGVLGPPRGTEVITIEGVPRTFQVWEFEDPGQGPVRYYRWDADR